MRLPNVRSLTLSLTLSLALLASACGTSGTPVDAGADQSASVVDMTPPAADMLLVSACGHPGDVGNSIGVGKFCANGNECSATTKAHLCSAIGNFLNVGHHADDTYFCTVYPCHLDAGADECGDNATCSCDSSSPPRCACTPNSCLGKPSASDGGAGDGGA